MKKSLGLIVLTVFMLTGCVSSTSKLTERFAVNNSQIYKESITLRDKTIPLPPGEWKIIASGEERKFFKLYLLQELEDKLFNYIYISVDIAETERKWGYKGWDKAKRVNMHHVVLENNTRGAAQDAWVVNNAIVHFTPKKKYKITVAAANYIKSNGFIISNDMIEISHRLTGQEPFLERYLYVSYSYTPEAEGFSPEEKGSWSTSAWNAMRINEDPRKGEYIQDLIEKHTLIHKKIKQGFHP